MIKNNFCFNEPQQEADMDVCILSFLKEWLVGFSMYEKWIGYIYTYIV